MSAGITVEDFKYVRGVNDAEYIELLKNAYEGQKYITSKAIAKLKKQPERKVGRWILHPEWEIDGECFATCSECEMGVDALYNFCPRCGAKMGGRTDGQQRSC